MSRACARPVETVPRREKWASTGRAHARDTKTTKTTDDVERAHRRDARVTRVRHDRITTMSARIVIGRFSSVSCRARAHARSRPSLAARDGLARDGDGLARDTKTTKTIDDVERAHRRDARVTRERHERITTTSARIS